MEELSQQAHAIHPHVVTATSANPNEPWAAKWKIVQPLGNGGQGDTFVVQSIDEPTKQAVLKLQRPLKTGDPKARRRMYHEVTNLRVLNNAGGKVPYIFDDNTDSFEKLNVPLYFVMEFIRGATLADTLKERETLSVELSVQVALDLCFTLGIAAKEGIIHRDIKPENLLVGSLDPVNMVIVDFGLSFNEDDQSSLTETEETLDNKFLSLPEHRGPGENKRDPRSDLTGVCAILLHCLTGCVPRNLMDSQGRLPHRWPDYLLSKWVADPRHLSALNMILDRGLNHEIGNRFQSVEELVGRLREVLNPNFPETIESMEVVAAREAAALLKTDRKTQLAECKAYMELLSNSFHQCAVNLAVRLQSQSAFQVHPGGADSTEKVTEWGDRLALFSLMLHMPVHQRNLRICYMFVFTPVGECAVYKRYFGGGLKNDDLIDAPFVLLTRYPWNSPPPSAMIIADVEPTVTKAIQALGASVRGGSK